MHISIKVYIWELVYFYVYLYGDLLLFMGLYDVFMYVYVHTFVYLFNKRVSQMRAPLATRHEPAGIQIGPPNGFYIFEQKTKYIVIHIPHIRTVAFWHIGIIPPMISWSQICYNTPYFI